MSLKYPVTPPGIDPGTVRLVAQRLNHYDTPGPDSVKVSYGSELLCRSFGVEYCLHNLGENVVRWERYLLSLSLHTFGPRRWWKHVETSVTRFTSTQCQNFETGSVFAVHCCENFKLEMKAFWLNSVKPVGFWWLYNITDSIKVKVKVKFTLQQATKAQRSRGIALLFL